MIPWTLHDTAVVPGGGEMRLKQRGAEYSIMLGSIELMNSRLSGSETALATLSCERLRSRPSPTLLIGGLGMGFTLRAALEVLPKDARVVVAELVPAVVDWARGAMAPLFGTCLDDPRVNLRVSDVGEVMRASRATYDAILLDVDNGPDGLTRKGNDALYSPEGLAVARQALVPGGLLSVWSCEPDLPFSRRLRRSGFEVEEKRVRAHAGKSGANHMIWLATRNR